MKNKDTAVLTVLSKLELTPEVELTDEDEHIWKYATDEEYRYLTDLKDIHTQTRDE